MKNPSKVIKLENVICAWAALDKPYSDDPSEDKKYILRMLINKNDEYNLNIINEACNEISRTLGDDPRIKKIKLPIYSDGADAVNPRPEYYFLNAKSAHKPSIIDANKEPFEPQSWEDFKTGMLVNVVLTLRLYDFKGNVGISKYLLAVQRLKMSDVVFQESSNTSVKRDYLSYFDKVDINQSKSNDYYEMEI